MIIFILFIVIIKGIVLKTGSHSCSNIQTFRVRMTMEVDLKCKIIYFKHFCRAVEYEDIYRGSCHQDDHGKYCVHREDMTHNTHHTGMSL